MKTRIQETYGHYILYLGKYTMDTNAIIIRERRGHELEV